MLEEQAGCRGGLGLVQAGVKDGRQGRQGRRKEVLRPGLYQIELVFKAPARTALGQLHPPREARPCPQGQEAASGMTQAPPPQGD